MGIAENVGHKMTWLIYCDATSKLIERSEVRSALTPSLRNLQLDPLKFDQSPTSDVVYIKDKKNGEMKKKKQKTEGPTESPPEKLNGEQSQDSTEQTDSDWSEDLFERVMIPLLDENKEPKLDLDGEPIMVMAPHPDDLKGKTFLTNPDLEDENGRSVRKRLRIIEQLDKHEKDRNKHDALMKFRVINDRNKEEDIMTYNDILNHIERDNAEEDGTYWKFRDILAHEHTPKGHKNRNGSEWNIQMQWENGEITWEPLSVIGVDAPVDCALYAKKNQLLGLKG